ncbi:MAG: hypothetical protein VX624_05895 [Pseudomonadota bacterium]|nr:hypothetical protein [Pseudomonadota bacterium]
MATELLFGIQTNDIRHAEANGMLDIDTTFQMVKEAGVQDYVDKTPDPHEIEEFEAASQKFGLPVRAGGWLNTLGHGEPIFEKNIKTAKRLGSLLRNTQILTHHADGHPVTNEEVVETYLHFCEIGGKHGVSPPLRSPCEYVVGRLPPDGRLRHRA